MDAAEVAFREALQGLPLSRAVSIIESVRAAYMGAGIAKQSKASRRDEEIAARQGASFLAVAMPEFRKVGKPIDPNSRRQRIITAVKDYLTIHGGEAPRLNTVHHVAETVQVSRNYVNAAIKTYPAIKRDSLTDRWSLKI